MLTDSAGNVYTDQGNSVYINSSGYFYANNAPGQFVSFGTNVWFGVGSSQFQLGTLLHEYGHWNMMPGFTETDTGVAKLQNSEDAQVLANCGKVVNP